MGVLHLDLVRVANHHGQEEMSLDNMGMIRHYHTLRSHLITHTRAQSYTRVVASQPSLP